MTVAIFLLLCKGMIREILAYILFHDLAGEKKLGQPLEQLKVYQRGQNA